MSDIARHTPPEERILLDGIRDCLAIVIERGTPEQKSRLQPFDYYTFPLDVEAMKAEEARYNAACDELMEIAMRVR